MEAYDNRKFSNQHELNKEIEALILRKDAGGESWSPAEVAFANRYTGAGGLASKGAKGAGILYEFYTPEWVCKILWDLAMMHGYDGGAVLEPSAATGRLLQHAPDKSKCHGFETNPFSLRIAQLNHPTATFHHGNFETAFLKPPRFTTRLQRGEVTWLPQYPFSLVIGNPPFGTFKSLYSSFFAIPGVTTLETFFIHAGLALLKPGGLLAYVLSSSFLRNGGTYTKAKEQIFKTGELVDAFRLFPVFQYSEVPIDILILRRK